MLRFNTLFWKIFGTIWLISSLAMSSVFLVLASRDDQDRWRHLFETQFKGQALELIRDYEANGASPTPIVGPDGSVLGKPFVWDIPDRLNRFYLSREERRREDWHRDGRDSGRYSPHSPRNQGPKPPIWLYQVESSGLNGQQITGHRRAAPPDAFVLNLTSETGRAYRLMAELPPPLKHKERFAGYLFSIQMIMVMGVAAISALILSFMLIRPIRQLSEHVKQIYHQGDLSTRASRKLSQRHDELGELTREFDHMADYVERTLQSQQRLLQDVSHELRAPMARLQVSAGLAEQQLGEGSTLAQRINRECERLDGLIAEILSFSRLESAKKEGDRFAVKDLFDELVSDLRFSQPERPVNVQIEPESLHLNLNGDLLARALRNGIGNALKYTPKDSLLELSARQQGGELLIQLRDHGEGISDDLLKELFTPFVRGTGGHGDGYGLGMSIARRAVERLGGTLTAENHPEGGLQLSVRLPV